MTSIQKAILTILSIIACGLAGLVGYYGLDAYQFYANQPLGPQLPEFSPFLLPPTWTPAPGSTPAVPMGAVTFVPTISFATERPQTYCNGPYVMTILAIGSDARADTYKYGLGDVIRVLRVDFATPKVSVLEFPRDLWVQIPFIADNLDGQDHERLNQAYLYGNPGDGFGYWDDPSGGSGLTALTLDLNFGVKADHYIAVNMRTFEKVVNAVGGVDVTIPDQETANATDLSIGNHHLNGPQALKVARRRDEGVFQRANNQNLIMCALREKITSPTVVTQLPELIASFQDNIQTDFTPEELGQLACLGAQLPRENIAFASFPQELFTPTRVHDPVFGKNVFVWDVDFNILRQYVASFNAGTWPDLSQATEEEETTSLCQ